MTTSVLKSREEPDCATTQALTYRAPVGATWRDGDCEFVVWAPRAQTIDINLLDENRTLELERNEDGYFHSQVSNVDPEARYTFTLNKATERADPASRHQPQGVFGASKIVDPSTFLWQDGGWRGLPLKDYVLYEVHVGVCTPSGTFDELADRLTDLKSLGVTAIEIMPVAQFPGSRNWGYDGVFPFAVQNSYGGPGGLQRFVDACHREGFAVVLDVVYNHLGPEGNFLGDFGPFFTDRYKTPWGQAVNFDGPQSNEVARFFIANALYWLDSLHIDALRLDAIHDIFDHNARPFLSLLSSAVEEFATRVHKEVFLIAESDLNDPRFVQERSHGGFGLQAQWNDDFHHALHALQTGERNGYYRDFGSILDLKTALQCGYVYSGKYSEFRQCRHGAPSTGIRASQLVVFSQNHDQVGNRGLGERTSSLIAFEDQKLSAGVVLLSPYIPLLFMGEEYGETAPFLYFTDHSDPALGQAVRQGRQAEFSGFHGTQALPDPQAISTFRKSKLNDDLRHQPKHKALRALYQELLHLRATHPSFADLDGATVNVATTGDCLTLFRSYAGSQLMVMFNFGDKPAELRPVLPEHRWSKLLNSSDTKWMGPGNNVPEYIPGGSAVGLLIPPKSFCVYGTGGAKSSVSSLAKNLDDRGEPRPQP